MSSSHLSRGTGSVLINSRQAGIRIRMASTIDPHKPRLRPRLPVPDLHHTLSKYLTSLEPYMLEKEARGGPSFKSQLQERVKWAETFEHGVGKLCQERLMKLESQSPHNWLDDNFWLKTAYHEWRAPLLVNSNWWLALKNDPTSPIESLKTKYYSGQTEITTWQVRRATWLLHRFLEYKVLVESQPIYSGNSTTSQWMRQATASVFNVARVPQKNCDSFSPLPSPDNPDAQKVVVMVHDWFYAISVYDSNSGLLTVAELEHRISDVVCDAALRLERGEKVVPVGLLSADQRDLWADNLHRLLAISETNRSTLRKIQYSLMALSLDHCEQRPVGITTAIRDPEVDAHLHNIRSGSGARNRWFDKPITLIVEPSGRAGVNGEHSPCDALVPSMIAEYALQEPVSDAALDTEQTTSHIDSIQTVWERLDWVTNEMIERECERAGKRAQAIIENSDDSVLWFSDYGTDWIRDIAKLAPDAYIQMALQLTWYRTRACFTATYETALTRLFLHGRTETIRTFTTASRSFVLAMADPQCTELTRYRRLQHAVHTHANLTRAAATGKGIDRHLLGLRLMIKDGERCDLFDDELFQQSQEWKLSTSGLSAGANFRGTGFGAMFPDGYGINYLAASMIIKFGVESKISNSQTSTDTFKTVLVDALLEMKSTCIVGLMSDQQRSHL